MKGPDRTRWDDRKLDHVRPFLEAAEAGGRFGVVAIVQAQEFQWVFSGTYRSQGKLKRFDFVRAERRCGIYYRSRRMKTCHKVKRFTRSNVLTLKKD